MHILITNLPEIICALYIFDGKYCHVTLNCHGGNKKEQGEAINEIILMLASGQAEGMIYRKTIDLDAAL